MRSTPQHQTDISTRQPPLAWLSRLVERLALPPVLTSIVLAIILAVLAGWLAITLSRAYYAVAPYHYDSASYRLQSVQFHDMLQAEGFLTTFLHALQTKDSLDVSLRLLFAPGFLLNRFGHLAVLLPFMSVWIFLVIRYIFLRTGSLLLGLAAVAFLFTFPLMYSPNQGIADYGKDTLATWLLGSAIVTWMLSQTLTRSRWAALSGLFLGLLVMQRSVAAIYAALLFLPPFFWAVYRRIRQDGWLLALARIVAFVAPAVLLGGIVILMQWQLLYKYYFVAGYGYGTPARVARYLLSGLRSGVGPAAIVLLLIYVACLFSISDWRQQLGEIVTAGWMLIGLPFLVMATSAFYFGFFPIWTVLLIVFLATVLPRGQRAWSAGWFVGILLTAALVMSVLQYHFSSIAAGKLAERDVHIRQLYDNLANILLAQPEPRAYALLFDEIDGPFLNQVIFDRGIRLNRPVAYMTIHDSYERATLGDLTPQQIASYNMHRLEQYAGAIAVTYCDPNNVLKQPQFLSDGQLLAAPAAVAMSSYLLNSSHWRVVHKLDAPYGCLYVYQYSAQPLTEVERWQGVESYHALADIPLTLAVAPSVRMYTYTSRYQPEEVNGIYYQWLPSGKGGLHLTLFSDKARTVIFRAHAVPGPDRKDALRTLVVSDAGQETALRVDSEQDIQVQFDLQPGLNQVDLYVQEPADNKAHNRADTRELMLLLGSPHLVAGAD